MDRKRLVELFFFLTSQLEDFDEDLSIVEKNNLAIGEETEDELEEIDRTSIESMRNEIVTIEDLETTAIDAPKSEGQMRRCGEHVQQMKVFLRSSPKTSDFFGRKIPEFCSSSESLSSVSEEILVKFDGSDSGIVFESVRRNLDVFSVRS